MLPEELEKAIVLAKQENKVIKYFGSSAVHSKMFLVTIISNTL